MAFLLQWPQSRRSMGEYMDTEETKDFRRLPGLYRLWDLQSVIDPVDEWHVHYAEPAGDGTPLFAVYRRAAHPDPEAA